MVVCDWAVAALVSVTVTSGTGAPFASVTMPVSAPVVADWAQEGVPVNSRVATTIASSINRCRYSFDFIFPLKLAVLSRLASLPAAQESENECVLQTIRQNLGGAALAET